MKVGILAGGVGTRLAEETETKPKPMVEIGGKPILWHIMKHYSTYGFFDFVVALGYKGEIIKKYMIDYSTLNGNLKVNLQNGDVQLVGKNVDNWKIDLVDTGYYTATGGRIKRMASYFGNETFLLTWGDGVSNVDLGELIRFHKSHGRLATVTAVRPPARFGKLYIKENVVEKFSEKPQLDEGWINGAYYVLEPGVFEFIDGDETQWEKEPMERLAMEGQLMAYKHGSFWQCMDTLRDKKLLEKIWQTGNAPWKIWNGIKR
ncbi:glucose-1-phosphate cytidylyltransferase [candidate division KSB1 bacterium]|nr:glucose-1-phosphate cytidylyltransferase [candidate division KSB1 bacterium]